jgi:hypothetical protein
MKYLYIVLIGIVLINCSDKSVEVVESLTPTLTPAPAPKVKVVKEPVEMGAIEVVASANVSDKTLVADERKVTKNIKSDVPSGCAMWSDGCNVCTRTNSTKASCTTYPACHNRVVSCLQWN